MAIWVYRDYVEVIGAYRDYIRDSIEVCRDYSGDYIGKCRA